MGLYPVMFHFELNSHTCNQPANMHHFRAANLKMSDDAPDFAVYSQKDAIQTQIKS
jgi:hypothetical protein